MKAFWRFPPTILVAATSVFGLSPDTDPPPFEEQLEGYWERSDRVFQGVVVALELDETNERYYQATIEVERIWKGGREKKIQFPAVLPVSGVSSFIFQFRFRYLVFLQKNGETYWLIDARRYAPITDDPLSSLFPPSDQIGILRQFLASRESYEPNDADNPVNSPGNSKNLPDG